MPLTARLSPRGAVCFTGSILAFRDITASALRFKMITRSLCITIGARTELVELYDNIYSSATEHAQAAEYHTALAKLAAGKQDELGDLELQSFVENYRRSNWTAVMSKIQNKKIKGTYADMTTALFDVASNYHGFMQMNFHVFPDPQELSTLARTMVFQQLNGSDSS
jgi:hypothetical protein